MFVQWFLYMANVVVLLVSLNLIIVRSRDSGWYAPASESAEATAVYYRDSKNCPCSMTEGFSVTDVTGGSRERTGILKSVC